MSQSRVGEGASPHTQRVRPRHDHCQGQQGPDTTLPATKCVLGRQMPLVGYSATRFVVEVEA